MFAIIQTGGKQIHVTTGQEIFVEKLNGNVNDKIIFDKVLMIDQQVGKPFLKGAQVCGEILKQGKQKKIVVFKYKPKKNSKTKYGHRQPYTRVKIIDILLEGKKNDEKDADLKILATDQTINSQTKATIATEKSQSLKTKPTVVAIKEPSAIVKKVVNENKKTKPQSENEELVPKTLTSPTNDQVDPNIDPNKTVVKKGKLETIFDHQNMTVKIVEVDDNESDK